MGIPTSLNDISCPLSHTLSSFSFPKHIRSVLVVFELNIMYLVFDEFKFNLLQRNHFATLLRDAFILLAASSNEASVVLMVVSSENFTNSAVLSQLFMSLG